MHVKLQTMHFIGLAEISLKASIVLWVYIRVKFRRGAGLHQPELWDLVKLQRASSISGLSWKSLIFNLGLYEWGMVRVRATLNMRLNI